MQSLSDQAIAKARKTIADKFSDPNALEELGTMGFNLEKNLLEVEGQLNGAVQSKLDSLKRAVDLMDESATKLTLLSTSIARTDERIALTNTAISNFANLKRAANARENLRKVLDQVDFFASVPERVAALRDRLAANSLSLKEAYLEAIKLESLRAALIKEMKVSRNRRMSVDTTTLSGGAAGMLGAGEYSEETYSKVRESVEKHLRLVPEFVKELRGTVMNIIDRMFDIAPNTPEEVVGAFEIIEMQAEYNERRNQQEQKAAASTKRTIYENITADVAVRIRKILDHQIEGEFEAMSGYLQTSKSTVTAFITAANQCLFRIKFFLNDIIICIPPHYDCLFIFLESFEFYFTPKLEDLVAHMSALKVAEILDLITWIEYHKVSLEDFDFTTRESIAHYSNLKTELLMEYKERIKSQVHEWFANIAAQSVEISVSDKMLITNKPEDMFNIIHAQISVAHEKLPPEYVKEVGIACLQVLQDVQRQTYDMLHNQKSDGGMEVELICVLINDNQRMQEKCDEFGQDLLKILQEDDKDREMVEIILDEVSREYLSIAQLAVDTLSHCLVDVLDEAVFCKLYTTDWEGSDDPISIMLATLKDYFDDLKEWLSAYHFGKLVKELLCLAIRQYVMYLRRKLALSIANQVVTNNALPVVFTFTNELLAAKKIIQDRFALEDFFSKFLPLPGVKTMDNLREEFEPFTFLTKIITTRSLQVIDSDCRNLFKRYGIDGLRLVQAGLLSNPSVPRADRQANSDNARKLFESLSSSQGYTTAPAADLANLDSAFVSMSTGRDAAKKGGFWNRFGGRKDGK